MAASSPGSPSVLETPCALGSDVVLEDITSAAGVHTSITATVAGTRLSFDAGVCTDAAVGASALFISHGHMDHASAMPSILARRGGCETPSTCEFPASPQACSLAELIGIAAPLRVYALAACVDALTKIIDAYRELSKVGFHAARAEPVQSA